MYNLQLVRDFLIEVSELVDKDWRQTIQIFVTACSEEGWFIYCQV